MSSVYSVNYVAGSYTPGPSPKRKGVPGTMAFARWMGGEAGASKPNRAETSSAPYCKSLGAVPLTWGNLTLTLSLERRGNQIVVEVETKMSLSEILIRQLEPPVKMLLAAVETCPDDVWADLDGDWPVGQHVLHATYFFDRWMRADDMPFTPPAFVDVDVAEMERTGDPVDRLPLRGYLADVHARAVGMLGRLSDEALTVDIEANGEVKSVADVTIGQIRHLMYHAGCVSSILRQATGRPLIWIGFHKPI